MADDTLRDAAEALLAIQDADLDYCFGCHGPRPCEHDALRAALAATEPAPQPADLYTTWQGACGHLWRYRGEPNDCPTCNEMAGLRTFAEQGHKRAAALAAAKTPGHVHDAKCGGLPGDLIDQRERVAETPGLDVEAMRLAARMEREFVAGRVGGNAASVASILRHFASEYAALPSTDPHMDADRNEGAST